MNANLFNESGLTPEAPKPKPKPKERSEKQLRRDRVNQFICDTWFSGRRLEGTKSRIGGLTTRLGELSQFSVEEIIYKQAAYMREWPGITCTAEALVKNWDNVGIKKAATVAPQDTAQSDYTKMLARMAEDE